MALALALHDLRHLMQYMLGFVLLTLVFSTAAWPRVVIDQLLGNRIDMPAVFGVFVAGLGLVTLVDYLRQPKQSFKALFFLNHNFDHNALVEQAQTVATWPQMLVGWGTLALSYVIFSTDLIDRSANWRNMVHSDLSREGLLLLLVAIFIVPLVNYLIPLVTPHLPDPDVVRWATPGNVSQEWRREVNRGLSTEWTPPSEQTVRQMATATVRYVPDSHASALLRTYQVIHAPGDEKTAKQVKIVLDRLRYQAVSSEATYMLLILSFHTTLPLIRKCLEKAHQVIGLLATDVNLPDDLPELTSLQLVDYRSGSSEQLYTAFGFFGDDTETARAVLAEKLLPVNLAQTGENRDLGRVISYLVILLYISLIYTTYVLARLAIFHIPLVPMPEAFQSEALGVAGLLLINLLFIWFAMGVRHGVARIHSKLFILVAGTVPVIIALIELVTRLPPQVKLTLLSTELLTIHLGVTQALTFIGLYSLVLLILVSTFFGQPHLLNSPKAHALGLHRVKPNWSLMNGSLVVVTLLLLVSLISSSR